jgi:predicted metal-dependent hydrolase
MPRITVGEIHIEVIRKEIKNIHLGVYPPHGRVRIAAPLSFDDEAVRLFAVSKMAWVKRQQAKFQNQERQTRREYVTGESHYVNGTRYLLNVIYGTFAPKVVLRSKTYIDLYVREGSAREQRERVMKEWYRKQLKEQIPGLLEKWRRVTGVEVESWGVKLMKTKWGTCNAKAKRIWLNLELAKKPGHSLEYIMVHEMVHLLERRHNERFVAYMDKFMPRWRVYKEELNSLILGHADWDY